MKARSSRLSLWVSVSAILGVILASWLAPKGIAWYFDPPVDIGVNCRAATEWSMRRLLIAQGGGLSIGAVAGFVISMTRKKGAADTEA